MHSRTTQRRTDATRGRRRGRIRFQICTTPRPAPPPPRSTPTGAWGSWTKRPGLGLGLKGVLEWRLVKPRGGGTHRDLDRDTTAPALGTRRIPASVYTATEETAGAGGTGRRLWKGGATPRVAAVTNRVGTTGTGAGGTRSRGAGTTSASAGTTTRTRRAIRGRSTAEDRARGTRDGDRDKGTCIKPSLPFLPDRHRFPRDLPRRGRSKTRWEFLGTGSRRGARWRRRRPNRRRRLPLLRRRGRRQRRRRFVPQSRCASCNDRAPRPRRQTSSQALIFPSTFETCGSTRPRRRRNCGRPTARPAPVWAGAGARVGAGVVRKKARPR